MFRKCCCAQVFADVMAQECCARSGFTQHWWVMLATDSDPHFWLFGPFHSALFWPLPHSAPVGIYHRIYSAGFYFNFLFFITLHPNLDSFVSRNITKAVVPPCGQMLQTRSVEIALLMQIFCSPRQKNGFCQGKGQPGWKQWIQTWISTNLFYAIQNSKDKNTSSKREIQRK